MGKKTLGQQLSELSNPLPVDFDPEVDASDSSFESDENNATEHYLPVGKSNLRNDMDMHVSEKYKGIKVSRMDVDMGIQSESDYEINSQEDSDDSQQIPQENSEDEDQDSEEDEFNQEKKDLETDLIEKELAEIRQEEKKIISSLSSSSKNDVEKGEHVQSQLAIWDSLLDSRIRIQKMIECANRLPIPETFSKILEKSDSKLQESINSASVNVISLIEDLICLRKNLLNNNSTIDISVDIKKRKHEDIDASDSTLDNLWNEIEKLDNDFKPFRNQTIEKWNQKVQLASGIPMQKKFKVVNQSVNTQIQEILKDKERLLKRSQLCRSKNLPLGYIAPEAPKEGLDEHLSLYIPHIYDDDDFYQEMLKELIESRVSSAEDPSMLGINWADLKTQKQRKKKKVDTRASKGRKIRYHVQEKIQNFMAPEPRGTWHNEMCEELFSSLFGLSGIKNLDVAINGATDGFKILG